MAAAAALALKQPAAFSQLRHSRNLAFLMAAAAGSTNVFLREQGIWPEVHFAVCRFFVCRETLTAMTDGATKSRRHVRAKVGVVPEGFRRILHGRIFNAEVGTSVQRSTRCRPVSIVW